MIGRIIAALAPAKLTIPLSIGQLISWGSIYYCFTLFIEPMEMELHLGRTSVTGALTIGLLTCSLCSLLIGMLIDKGHGRSVMTSGALLGGLMLVAWSQISTVFWLYVVWAGMGVALSATLYEPAFAILVRHSRRNSNKGITFVTLVSGLASTLFIPLTHLLIDAFDWRIALLALAALNLLITTPLYYISLREQPPLHHQQPAQPSYRKVLQVAVSSPAFWFLSAGFSMAYFAGSGLIFHVIPMLTERGYALEHAVYAAALYGPSMLAARLGLSIFSENLRITTLGILAIFPVVLGLFVLAVGPYSLITIALFAFALGAGNGILAILKPMTVSQLFEKSAFGAINGAMTVPLYILRAFAPSSIAIIWTLSKSYNSVIWLIIGLLCIAFLLFLAGLISAKNTTKQVL